MLLATVRRTIHQRALLERGIRVLVAVSGGAGSLAMLDVLARLRSESALELEAASIDHGLRPDAGREIDLARRQAERIAVPFYVERVDVAGAGSVQARARKARYEALHRIARGIGASAIAVGHTRDDQAETVLSRLLRGSGPHGLSGITPRRADGVVRPLIDASRAEARRWCIGHGIAFADDPSNGDPRFQRARLRHRILPLLAAESPAIVEHLARLADDLRAPDEAAVERARAVQGEADAPSHSSLHPALDARVLERAESAVRAEVWRAWSCALTQRPFRHAHLDALEGVPQGKGEARLPGAWTARREGDWVVARRGGEHGIRNATEAVDLQKEARTTDGEEVPGLVDRDGNDGRNPKSEERTVNRWIADCAEIDAVEALCQPRLIARRRPALRDPRSEIGSLSKENDRPLGRLDPGSA